MSGSIKDGPLWNVVLYSHAGAISMNLACSVYSAGMPVDRGTEPYCHFLGVNKAHVPPSVNLGETNVLLESGEVIVTWLKTVASR
jgi:hypothetical protein